MSLPPEIYVHASRDRVLYRLPFRRVGTGEMTSGVAGCLALTGGVFAVLLVVYLGLVGSALEKRSFFAALATAALASPLGLLGFAGGGFVLWLGVGGRSEVLLTPGRLLLRERIGPLVFRRSIQPGKIALFRVHPFGGGKGALDVEIQGGADRRWAVDYPVPLLEALAADLARRKDELLKSGPAGPAEVEIVGDAVRVTVRPTAWQNWLTGPVLFAMAFLTLVFSGVLGAAAERARDHVAAIAVLSGTLWAGAQALGLVLLRGCRRTSVLEVSDRRLRVVESDFLGRRTRDWARSEVWGFEVAGGRLQFRLSNGKRPTVLSGRDAATLEWIAGILRRGRPRRPVEIVATAQAKGTCQVCATEMAERVVWCRRCRTPHHLECWVYTGMCSTFGCREIGYVDA